jgi:Clp amino terminal domain, pathogenicity island component
MNERPDISPTLDELISTVQRRTPGDSALERLGAAVAYADDLSELADNLVGHFVSLARNEGASWAQIGEILGVSKQGAQQRFVPRGPIDAADFENRDLFGRFTIRARQVVINAEKHARRLRHDSVGTEHLLLGLTDEECIASMALSGLGVEATAVREQVEARVTVGEAAPEGHVPFSGPAKRILELTLREALKLGHNYIGTEHIVLALLTDSEGDAGQVLRELGVDYDALREKEIELIAEIVARRRSAG